MIAERQVYELERTEIAQGAMGTALIVLGSVAIVERSSLSDRVSAIELNSSPFKSSSRGRELKDSHRPFCQGGLDSMKYIVTPISVHHERRALAMNSDPLSVRR